MSHKQDGTKQQQRALLEESYVKNCGRPLVHILGRLISYASPSSLHSGQAAEGNFSFFQCCRWCFNTIFSAAFSVMTFKQEHGIRPPEQQVMHAHARPRPLLSHAEWYGCVSGQYLLQPSHDTVFQLQQAFMLLRPPAATPCPS